MRFELETWSHSWNLAKIIIIWQEKFWTWDLFFESKWLTTTIGHTFQNKIPWSWITWILILQYFTWSWISWMLILQYFRYNVHFPLIKVSIVIIIDVDLVSMTVCNGDASFLCLSFNQSANQSSLKTPMIIILSRISTFGRQH